MVYVHQQHPAKSNPHEGKTLSKDGDNDLLNVWLRIFSRRTEFSQWHSLTRRRACPNLSSTLTMFVITTLVSYFCVDAAAVSVTLPNIIHSSSR